MSGKNVLLNFKIAFLFVGTIIGAGFASGKELMSFFGSLGYYMIPIAIGVGAMFFYTCWLFLRMGKLIKPNSLSDITKAMYGKGAVLMDIFIVISYFIVMSAMLAGVESLFIGGFGVDLGFPLFSIITLVLSMFIVLKGIDGLISANAVLVPIIILFTVGIAASALIGGGGDIARAAPQGVEGVLSLISNSILYVCMNMLLTAAVLGSTGKTLKSKTIFSGSLIGSIMIAATILLIMSSIFSYGASAENADMPMLVIASQFGKIVAVAASLVIWFGVFTTLISSVFPIVEWSDKYIKKRYISIPLIAVIGFAISLLGFSSVVDMLYPVMGAIGLFFILSASIYYFKNRKKILDISV